MIFIGRKMEAFGENRVYDGLTADLTLVLKKDGVTYVSRDGKWWAKQGLRLTEAMRYATG